MASQADSEPRRHSRCISYGVLTGVDGTSAAFCISDLVKNKILGPRK